MIVVNSDGYVNSYWLINSTIKCCNLENIKNSTNNSNLNKSKEETNYNSYEPYKSHKTYNNYKSNRTNYNYKNYNKKSVVSYSEVTDNGTIKVLKISSY